MSSLHRESPQHLATETLSNNYDPKMLSLALHHANLKKQNEKACFMNVISFMHILSLNPTHGEEIVITFFRNKLLSKIFTLRLYSCKLNYTLQAMNSLFGLLASICLSQRGVDRLKTMKRKFVPLINNFWTHIVVFLQNPVLQHAAVNDLSLITISFF